MACSKIFSGELPEILSDIMQYFRNDFSTLHSYGRLIGDCIENWAAAVKKEKSLFWFVKNIQNSDFIKFIHKSLIEIFIENEANLYTFNVTHYHDYFDIVSESVLQNPHFIRNIKILYLKINEIFESIELLLQKSGDYLENFGLSFEPNTTYYNDVSDSQLLEAKSQLLKLITRYCTKVKFFELIEFNNNQNIYLTFDLIESIKQNLNYLTIDINYDFGSGFNRDTELSSIVLQNLGQILPFKLEYLDLTLVMNTTDFEIFLINSQDTFIKKLLFSNIIDRTREEVRQDNLLYNIKDHIMEMKRVKYFAFQNHFTDDGENDEDLFHLIDEVKEYNIVIQNYNDLKIKFIEFLVD
ncbi:hypothetical protein GLOIN_2v1775357 [Rhizophagus irregularis DAOM 181602=DAOM 197198]|nr:hypothetical protein GLOIN_2v1775357 [Rhizophagus irregularis DAOM 181602=DAOM 197198]